MTKQTTPEINLIDVLASYVPILVAQRIADAPAPVNTPISETLPAAVLFADISGFTTLTERLAEDGPVGAENLTQHLNTYFSRLIDLITTHGGDIVKFAGDALIALFPGPDPSPATLRDRTLQAAQCSLEARRQLNHYRLGESLSLSLKLAIGAGDVKLLHLGGEFGRWEFLVSGEPIAQVGEVGKQARSGEIVLSPEAWALIDDAAQVVIEGQPSDRTSIHLQRLNETPSSNPLLLPTLPETAVVALRAYIPGAILDRLAAQQTGWMAELRRVSVIFANLPDLTYKMPLEQAQQLMRSLQAAVYRYEGSLNKLSVDEKGVTLVAAMGLPPLAHEDDADRAVKAALAIRKLLAQQSHRCAIGVTTGRAFCGSVGHPKRREYTMIGDVVNLSARLMQAALWQKTENDILCDEVTYRATRAAGALELMLGVDLDGSGSVGDVIDFEELGPISVKGKSRPVLAYRPHDRKTILAEPHNYLTGVVGRVKERRHLTERLKAVLQVDEKSVIILEGEAGIGKSRLVEDVLQQARLLGFNSYVGAGHAIDKSTPYHAWRSIFKQIFHLGMEEPARQRSKVLAQLKAEFAAAWEHIAETIKMPEDPSSPGVHPNQDERVTWERVAPLLDPVLPLDWPETPLTAQMTGKVRADNTQELLIRLLQHVAHTCNAAEAPAVMIMEDGQWLDSASWQLAGQVAQRVEPLVLVLVTRPPTGPIPAEYHQILGQPQAELMQLTGLSAEDTLTLVQQRLGVESLPLELSRLIYQKAQGNPFFSEELIYALRDRGLISINAGECSIQGDLQKLQLPDTVQGVVTSRIDQLRPAQQLTLKVASVIGRAFEYRTLHDIHPIPADRAELPSQLQQLQTLEITLLVKPAPEPAYIFKHAITQEAAYDLMLFAQRRDLHRAVAEWLESHYADDLSPFYGLLAHHWREAQAFDRAIDYLELAGEEALRSYANEEAIRFFGEALHLSGREPQGQPDQRRGRWELKLGEAYVNWVKFKEGQIHLERGLRLLGYPLPPNKIRLGQGLLRQVGQRLWRQLRTPTPNLAARRTLLEAAQAYEGLTAVYYFANQTAASLYAALQSLSLAEQAGPSPELARGYASVGVILSFVPLHNLAESYCRRALEMASQVKSLSAQAWVTLLAGIYHVGVGHWPEAHFLFEQTIDLAEQLGDRRRWDDGVGNLAALHYFRADFEESRRFHTAVLASAERRGDAHNQAWALRGQIYGLLLEGEFEPALTALARLDHLLRQERHIVDEALNIDRYGLLAVVHLHCGDSEAALAAVRTAATLIDSSSPTSYLSLPGYAGVAETYLTLWEWQMMAELGLDVNELNRSQIQQAQARQYCSPYKAAAREACRALHRYARVFPIGQPRAHLWQGVFEWLSGRPRVAGEQWSKGLKAAKRLGMPYAEGLLHLEIARHLPASDTMRAEHLTQATRIFERITAAYDLKRAKVLVETASQPS